MNVQGIKPGFLLIGIVGGFLVGAFLGFISTRGHDRTIFQAEAIKAGHAQYKIVDEFGKVAFEWLPPHGTEKPMTGK